MMQFEIDDAGIATVTLRAPAMRQGTTENLLHDLQTCIDSVGNSSNISSLVIAYEDSTLGPFVPRPKLPASLPPAEMLSLVSSLGDLFRRIETCGKPVVATILGDATDEALELALACHYRVVENQTDAVFGFPNAPIGRFPVAGATQRLPRLVGIEKALPILVEGRTFGVAQGLALGIFDISAEAGSALRRAKEAILEGKASSTATWDRKGFEFPGMSPTSASALDLFTRSNALALAAGNGRQRSSIALLSSVFEGVRLPIEKALRVEQKLHVDLVRRQKAHA
jgi:3-hydroxyacyl-CoA dehydrogenase / enoyl-CoA hydratase / 3-hydroxybutyryl-CoA epimerase